ncbi:putative RNA-directed DNA polymerase from transposon X-element, partial [Aspergillus affinis]|uniref:putative RNA-directed DNA polymerase from transposon X-element n=1 Tax=Aspergillus affinis TaxID=1070780 RepID=UPI0022FEF6A5
NGLAETAEQKVEVFQKAFFLYPPPADLSDIPATSLPQQLDFPDLAEHEVLRCIRKAPPDKAPGPDGISNKVWHWLGEVPSFVKALTDIFNACIRLGHNPGYFQQSITVVFPRAETRSYLSRIISTPTGIPQGFPISPILFLLFNTPLIRALEINTVESMRIQPPISGRTLAFGWIDDACTIALSGSYAANQRLLEWALDKAAVWSGQHSSRFAPDKFELIHFRNPLDPDPGAERDTPCDYTEPWNGQDLTNANREDGSAWEVPVESLGHDQLPIKDHVTGHVIRPVKYAKYLGIWLDKTLSFTTHCAKAVAKANGSLEALRSISASTWALGAELFLPPVRLYMQQMIEETAIRIQTGPVMACPRGLVKKRSSAEIKRSGWSPIEALRWRKGGPLWTRGRSLTTWESRKAHVLAPWELPLNCVIEGADSAVQEHDRICQENRRQIWYSNGSGFNGHVKGATVSIRAGKVRKKYLGAAADSTVQAAIQAVQNPGRPSGQYVLRAIYERIRTLRGSGLQQEDIELRWIPAHIGIEGNERADEAAKRAAIKGIKLSSAGPRELAARPITRLAAAAKTDPNKKVLRIYEGLSKPQTSIIIQMRTMRIGLRHFLFEIKQVDSDRCGYELGSQTPKYVLMECSLHLASQRIVMERLDSIEGLRRHIQDYDAVMNHPQAIRYVADFVQ